MLILIPVLVIAIIVIQKIITTKDIGGKLENKGKDAKLD